MSTLKIKNELVFKKFFTDEKNIELLVSMVNSFLEGAYNVEFVSFDKPFNPVGDFDVNELFVIEFKSKDHTGVFVKIEVLLDLYALFQLRPGFVSNEYIYWLSRDKRFDNDLKKKILIFLISHEFLVREIPDEYLSRKVLRQIDMVTNEEIDIESDFELYFASMQSTNIPSTIVKDAQRWMWFFSNVENVQSSDIPAEVAVNKEIVAAVENFHKMTLSSEEQEIYEAVEANHRKIVEMRSKRSVRQTTDK